MIEGFFVVLVIFIAYMVYTIVIQPKKAASEAEALKPKSQPKKASSAKSAKPAAKVATKPIAKEQVKQSTPAKANSEIAEAVSVLRNPKTKETSNVPNNYRFAKRWIKEALVEEGLLDKIYKNNELDGAASEKVKVAIGQLKTIKKYHG